jgi:hypothetical protein
VTPASERLIRAALKAARTASAPLIDAIGDMLDTVLLLEGDAATKSSRARASAASRWSRHDRDASHDAVHASLSLSDLKDLKIQEREKEGERERESETRIRVRPEAPTPAEVIRYTVSLDSPITPDLEAIAARANVANVLIVWRKFCCYYAGKLIPVDRDWERWCLNERPVRAVQLALPSPRAPPSTAEALARERQEDAEFRKRCAEAVPAPPASVATILASLGVAKTRAVTLSREGVGS